MNNIRGNLLDANGFAFVFFGAYTYGVSSDVERSIPETEVQFGRSLILPVLVCRYKVCFFRNELDWALSQ